MADSAHIPATPDHFLALHAPWGAYAPFVLGVPGAGGGFALSDVHSPQRSVYVAYRQGTGAVQLLPFLAGAASSGEAAFLSGQEVDGAWHAAQVRLLNPADVGRQLGWASDTWTHGPLTFSLRSPFGPVPPLDTLDADAARRAVCPATLAVLELDNRASTEHADLLFGLDGVNRTLDLPGRDLLGVAGGRVWGVAARSGPGVEAVQDFDLLGAAFGERRPRVRPLGASGGVRLRVPPGEVGRLVLALGSYQAGVVTTGLDARMYYATLFDNLEDVLVCALDQQAELLARAQARDDELRASGLSAERQFLLAHATHGYLASTQLLARPDGSPLWAVNEGEYRMLNTLDLTVDQLFWELRFHPWTVRNVLDLFAERYAYHDTVQGGGEPRSGGLSFTHDMGVANAFSPPGHSAYETPGLRGCFSYMTHEQLVNWTLCAAVYGLQHDRDWLRAQAPRLEACLNSVLARDGDADGVMDRDSLRCGAGSEITTYDSLDQSLGQARQNLYLAVKTWAALVCLTEALERVGQSGERARAQARRAAATIAHHFDGASGFIPAVFDGVNRSAIIPAVEGLAFPAVLGLLGELEGPEWPRLRDALARHLDAVLRPGVCLDPLIGGWKLSSTSENTWMSKIFLNQFVAERVFGRPADTRADAAHACWQRQGSAGSGPTDQVRATDGTALGSRLYPRLVTGVLWLAPGSPLPPTTGERAEEAPP